MNSTQHVTDEPTTRFDDEVKTLDQTYGVSSSVSLMTEFASIVSRRRIISWMCCKCKQKQHSFISTAVPLHSTVKLHLDSGPPLSGAGWTVLAGNWFAPDRLVMLFSATVQIKQKQMIKANFSMYELRSVSDESWKISTSDARLKDMTCLPIWHPWCSSFWMHLKFFERHFYPADSLKIFHILWKF